MDMRILQLDASKRVSKIHGTISLLLMTKIRKESPVAAVSACSGE